MDSVVIFVVYPGEESNLQLALFVHARVIQLHHPDWLNKEAAPTAFFLFKPCG